MGTSVLYWCYSLFILSGRKSFTPASIFVSIAPIHLVQLVVFYDGNNTVIL